MHTKIHNYQFGKLLFVGKKKYDINRALIETNKNLSITINYCEYELNYNEYES